VGSVPSALNAEKAQHVDCAGINAILSDIGDGDQIGTGARGSGAAGRVSVFTSATNVDGAANLLRALSRPTTS
jgi:hypothetical protein